MSATSAQPSQPPTPATLIGRDAELFALTQALSAPEGRPVCLFGPEGRGKTTLALAVVQALAQGSGETRTIYVSLAGGLLPEMVTDALGVALFGPQFTLADAETSQQLIAALASTPTLVVWDNLEAAFSPDALEYGAVDRARLLALARELAHVPGCRLLLLIDAPACPSELAPLNCLAMELSDLAAPDAAALLRGRLIGAALTEEEALRVATAWGGNPLVMRCAATYLATHPLQDLLDAGAGLLPGAQTVSLALELLLHELSPDDRLAANALGLFAGGFLEPLALRATGLPKESWQALKPGLNAAGLLGDLRQAGLNIGRIAPLPALQRHLARRVTPRQRQALTPEYTRNILGLWGWLPRAEERAPGLARRLARLELSNLTVAIDLALALGDLNLAVDLIQAAGPLLTELGFAELLAALKQRLDRATAAAIPTQGPLGRPAVQFMLRQAEALLQAGQGEQSAAVLQQLIQRITAENGQSYPPPEATLDQALALRLMTTLLKTSGRPEALLGALRQVIALLGQAHSLPQARQLEGQTWLELGEMLLLARQAEPAQEALRRGLDLAQQIEDLALAGGCEAQLGAVAVLRGEAEPALAHLQAAVERLTAAQAWPALTSVWGQIAAVHETARQDVDAARQALTQAIAIADEAGLAGPQAHFLMRRAALHARADNEPASEADLQRAAQVCRSARLAAPLLAALRALAELYLGQGRLAEAHVAAEEARQMGEAAGARGAGQGGNAPVANAPWEIYHLLQRIATAEGNTEAEAGWRAYTQQAFARSTAAPATLQQWLPLIQAVAESCRGQALSAEAAELVEQLEATPRGVELAASLWAILGGARGPELVQPLDHVGALVIRTILHGIDHPELFERPAEEGAPDGPAQVLRADGG